jgi:hypothetical protein
MNDFDKSLLKKVQEKCQLPSVNDEVIYSIQDLELLIERHTQSRYGEKDYKIGFYSKGLFSMVLNNEDADIIVYFLFYLLFNFPDRAGYTAHAIKKCYGYNIIEACTCGIKIYMNKDDFATINLIEALVNNYTLSELPKSVWDIFNSVKNDGLPHSREHLEKMVFSQM